MNNLRVIEETNALNLSYTLGINQFSDLTWQEFKEQQLMAPQDCSATQPGNYRVCICICICICVWVWRYCEEIR
jgi:hypothetical protein